VTTMSIQTLPEHQIALPGSDFTLWRTAVLRSAGMPVDWMDELADPTLEHRPAEAFGSAIGRQSAALARLAAQPVLREAVCWQVPRLVESVLDPLVHSAPDAAGTAAGKNPARRNSKWRLRERTAASYLQRYCTKNDTIGFFGPVAWARWTDGPDVSATVGPRLVEHSSVHFETWAVDELGAALLARHDLRPHLAPRPDPTNHLDGRTLHRPYRAPLTLDAVSAAVLRACDGDTPAAELAAELSWLGVPGLSTPDDVLAVLFRLAGDGLLTWDLDVPLSSWPERELADRLRDVPEPAVRDPALAELATLVRARDAVATVADPESLRAAMSTLDKVFTAATASAAFRRGGEHEAGRTLVYPDARRSVRLELGAPLLADLAPALDLVLRSARWFAADVARRYRGELDAVFDAAGAGEVPLSTITFQLGPKLVADAPGDKPGTAAAAELRRRWAAVLRSPARGGHLRYAAADLADPVAAAFPCTQPEWAAARYQSPDLMIAAPSLEKIVPGRTEVVLGELHVAMNTLDARSFLAQHPKPAELAAMIAADGLSQRVVPMLPKSSRSVSARTTTPAILADHYRYVSLGRDSGGSPRPPHPSAALRVRRRAGRLVVTSLAGDFEADIIEVLGEFISMLVATEFGILPAAPRTPRITVDRLVIQRETWRPRVADWALPHPRDEAGEYLAMRRWLDGNDVPRRFFVSTPEEPKPVFVDAYSPVLMQILGRLLRATERAHGPQATVALAEMLPDAEHCWLRDAEGRRYTSELRVVAVDRWPA
jgi:hypothetical protein